MTESRHLLRSPPAISIVVPCFNEEEVLKETAKQLSRLLDGLGSRGLIDGKGQVLFVDDGSRDTTWSIIENLSAADSRFCGIKLSINCGHQNALICGLLNARGDAVVSIDADLQDDVSTVFGMMEAYLAGADIVFGVRKSRHVDSFVYRFTAETYYRFLKALGVNIVFNHADFRLMSRRTVEALRQFGETNVFLRGIVSSLGFPTQTVFYDRLPRIAGERKYTFGKSAALAVDGITSFSIRPLRFITAIGIAISLASFLVGLWAIFERIFGTGYVLGWASTVVPIFFLGGIQLLSLGTIGEYIGKIYLETKHRPRFIVDTAIGISRADK